MTSKIFSKYVAAVRNHSQNFSCKSQDLLTTLEYFLKSNGVPVQAITIVNKDDEKHIFLPENNLKLNCKSRLVLNDNEPFQEVSFITCDDPQLEITRVFFDVGGQLHINVVPNKESIGYTLEDGAFSEAVFSKMFQSLFELGVIKASTLSHDE